MAITISGNGDMTGDYTFAGDVDVNGKLEVPAGDTASRPATGQPGEIRFNTDNGNIEYWSNTSDTPQWLKISQPPINIVAVSYLVIGGGGAGGSNTGGGNHSDSGGGGGAGGYRTNFGTGNISGGLSPVEAAMSVDTGVALDVSVGAGGVASVSAQNNGGNSVFHTITSLGGGAGGQATSNGEGKTGGSGGGNGYLNQTPGSGTAGQGFAGGNEGVSQTAGGGGGAGEAGDNSAPCEGGDGIASSITGTSVTRAGGGGAGGGYNQSGAPGGAGGGGTGGTHPNQSGTNGTANTGGGGGGVSATNGQFTFVGSSGGSGVVILRIPNTHSATFTGVTGSLTDTPGSDRVYTVTAGTGTVTFSKD